MNMYRSSRWGAARLLAGASPCRRTLSGIPAYACARQLSPVCANALRLFPLFHRRRFPSVLAFPLAGVRAHYVRARSATQAAPLPGSLRSPGLRNRRATKFAPVEYRGLVHACAWRFWKFTRSRLLLGFFYRWHDAFLPLDVLNIIVHIYAQLSHG